ncbi:hypothetical protein GCM10011390_00880 [Aureimonas endophytica]|uniref:Uncharacterized protein n=1 Tax=Aureimonas endophytica TaxID=2027858 RepID=A0A916ZCP2_9HYPH|nr:hypothetical protein [Aureimonas endophytica]GGD86104.1 hypothetical protein GCM10011390_00880 [Aureimonas endophytica]
MGLFSGIGGLFQGRHAIPELLTASAAEPATPPPTAPAAEPKPAEERIEFVTPDDLVAAIATARIARILLVGSAEANRIGGTVLARALAARSPSTILLDLGGGAARDMGSIAPAENIGEVVSSPTSFAHAIQRDRASRAHVIALRLGPGDLDETLREATETAFAALAEAYARSVVVFESVPVDWLPHLADDNTALVLPSFGQGRRASLGIEARLAEIGVTELVHLALPEIEAQSLAA